MLIANHAIVWARNVAGKLSFARNNPSRDDFHFALTVRKA
jgi:hypothetical protein